MVAAGARDAAASDDDASHGAPDASATSRSAQNAARPPAETSAVLLRWLQSHRHLAGTLRSIQLLSFFAVNFSGFFTVA